MIGVQEAKRLVTEHSPSPQTHVLNLLDAGGFVLAEDVLSNIDTPPFDQSAMDGFAFSFESLNENQPLRITGEVQTGNYFETNVKPGEAVRIFTGAAMPPGTDTVIIQEKVVVNEKQLVLNDTALLKGSNVRLKGSQLKKGEVALQKNNRLIPPAISFLAGLGIEKILTYKNPVVSIIVTGKELVSPGLSLPLGKIYESNSFGLAAALKQINISPASIQVVDDDALKIASAIKQQLLNDIIILTGGVSVGEYDFVVSALDLCGVRKIFHKVKQRPGKPFYFGKYNNTMVFALPGNPAAVITCFYEYVVPAISSFTKVEYFKILDLPLAHDFKKKPGLTFFVKGKTKLNEVLILENQESYKMNSFAVADCLVELDEDKEMYKAGDIVKVKMIV